MLRVIKRAVLSQCWFRVTSSVYLHWRGIAACADVPAICVESRDISIHQCPESYPRDRNIARQLLEQLPKLIFVSSDSIHDAVCVQREGAAHLRDRSTLRY